MPFKSEKQRRYLWANEPEIARDWTDTYGSRIQKNEGGITNTKKIKGQPHMLAYITPGEANTLQKLGGQKTMTPEGIPAYPPGMGDPAYAASESRSTRGPRDDLDKHGPKTTKTTTTHTRKGPQEGWTEQEVREAVKRGETKKELRDLARRNEEEKREERVEVFRAKNFNNPFDKFVKNLPYISTFNKMFGPFNNRDFFIDEVLGKGYYEGISEDEFYGLSPVEQEKALKDYLSARGSGTIDAYGRTVVKEPGGEGGQPWWMQQGYPSHAAWLAAQGGGGGGGTTTPVTPTQTISPFQQSLNTGIAQGISPYYVGADPTAANLAWGQQFNVDPRTMYRTTWADGGPIRQRYFLGKIVKKIGRAAKKVIKSPIGKAALIGGLGYWGLGKMGGIEGLRTMAGGDNWKAGILKNLFMQKDDPTKFSPWKIGIGAATLAPFLMGSGKEEEEGDVPFDYEGAKQAYLNEIMKIRRDAMAGTLDPSQFVYQGIKDGGRIGYADAGPVIKDAEEVQKGMDNELNPGWFDMIPFIGGYEGKYPVDKDQGWSMIDEIQKYKYEDNLSMEETIKALEDKWDQAIEDDWGFSDFENMGIYDKEDIRRRVELGFDQAKGPVTDTGIMKAAQGGRIGYDEGKKVLPHRTAYLQQLNQLYGIMPKRKEAQEGGLMDLGGMEKDYREEGGFVPIGGQERADDVPARLSKNEFVFTADAVRAAGGGDIDRGAEVMENVMENLEQGGQVSEESQGLEGARNMFATAQRLEGVL